MKLSIKAGSTSQSVTVFIQDSSSTTGAGKTGLIYSGITAYYTFAGANTTATAITMQTLALVTTAYATGGGGFIEIDATHMPGLYRFDIPDTALASGKGRSVVVYLTATGAAPCVLEIELTAWDNQDGVRAGLTALPNAAAGANGGLPTGDASGHVTFANTSIATVTNLTNLPSIPANWLTAAGIAASALNGKGDWNIGKTGYSLTQTFPANFSSLAITVGGAVTAGTVSDKTGYSLSQAFPTNFSSMAITVGGALTVGTNNDKTGYALTQTFPTNFSSFAIDASGRVDLGKILGVAVSTSTAQIGANVVQYAGANALVDINNLPKVDIEDIGGAAVSTTTAQLGVNVVKYNNASAQTDANNLPKVDVEAVNGNTTSAVNLGKANAAIGRGTVGSASTTTSITTSSFTGPSASVTGQFIGRTVLFDANTSTSALQGQATNITNSTGTYPPTFTVTALTTAPSAGDTFSIL